VDRVAQLGDQPRRELGGVDTQVRHADRCRSAEHVHAEPNVAGVLVDPSIAASAVDDDGGVGARALVQAQQRAVTRCLVLEHELGDDVATQAAAGCALEQRQAEYDASLVVEGAAAVDHALLDRAGERGVAPVAAVAFGHGVEMAVQDQRSAPARAGSDGDEVSAALYRAERRLRARQPRNVLGLERQGDRRQPHLGDCAFHDGDRCVLIFEDRTGLDQILEYGPPLAHRRHHPSCRPPSRQRRSRL
jgi:hypothetical protein